MRPPRGASAPDCLLSQSLNNVRSALKPGVLALAMLVAVTSSARLCATSRDKAM